MHGLLSLRNAGPLNSSTLGSSFSLREKVRMRVSLCVGEQSGPHSQPLLKNAHPVAEEDAFDLVVGEAAFDQPAGQGTALGVIREFGDEMGVLEFLLKRG